MTEQEFCKLMLKNGFVICNSFAERCEVLNYLHDRGVPLHETALPHLLPNDYTGRDFLNVGKSKHGDYIVCFCGKEANQHKITFEQFKAITRDDIQLVDSEKAVDDLINLLWG